MILLIITTIAVVANIVIGLFIFKRAPRSATNQLFFAMNIVIAMWSVANYFSLYPALDVAQIIWVRLVLFFAAPLTYLYFLFIHTFPSERLKLNSSVLYGGVGLTVVVMALTLTPFVFVELGEAGTPIAGPLIPVFALTVTFYIAVGLFVLVKKFRTARGKLRIQLQHLLYGSALMFLLILATVMFPAIILHNSAIAPYASLYTFIFAGTTVNAMVKHRLFSMQTIVARSVAYVALVTILFAFYTLAVFGTSAFLFHGHTNSGQVIIYAIMAIFVGATFQPLNHRLQHVTERIFFQTHYDSSDLLLRITKVLASTYNLEQLSQQVLSELIGTINISKGAVVVSIDNTLQVIEQVDMPDGWFSHDVLTQLSENRTVVEVGSIAAKALTHAMHKSQITVIVPLYVGDAFQGVMVLGEKQSGEIYDDQDMKVLEILSREVAVAVESARNVKQISDFNQTLRKEVEKATSQLREANEQLSRKNHQLQELDRLKDEFISVTSHELRTPLTAIRGYLWMVINGKKGNYSKTYLDRAYASSERLIDLVNDTLDISRIESGRVQLDPVPTKLPQIVKQVVTELEPKASERLQRLTVSRASHLPQVLCDVNKIHQVLINLIGNALKFTPEHGNITVHFFQDRGHVVTAITDNGPGISPDDQKKLFQKFSRVGNSGETTGTGLGLYLCQQIIRLSHGKIWVDSQEGKGSTFFFSLPISQKQSSIMPRPASFKAKASSA